MEPPGLRALQDLSATGSALALLQWSFHSLDCALVAAVLEGVRADTFGVGLEEEDVQLLSSQALHQMCIEAEFGGGVLPREVAPGALPHLVFRGDGQRRGEAEVLCLLSGDLRRAAQCAATAELLHWEEGGAQAQVGGSVAACAPPSSSGGGSACGRGRACASSNSSGSRTQPDFPTLAQAAALGEGWGPKRGHTLPAAPRRPTAPAPAPAPPRPHALLNPRAAALVEALECSCGRGMGSLECHTPPCREGFYRQLNERVGELARQRAALLTQAAAAFREKRIRAAAGSYAERAREVGAAMRATQELCSHVMLLASNPHLRGRGGAPLLAAPTLPSSSSSSSLNLGRVLGEQLQVRARGGGGGGGGDGGGGGAVGEVDLHGQHLQAALSLLRDCVLPGAVEAQCKCLRIITGAGKHSVGGGGAGGGVLREGVGHFLRKCAAAPPHECLGVGKCVAEGSGAFLVHFRRG
jgi:hypothetical protein